VFFIQDAIKFPDLIHSAKQEPDRGFPQAQTAHDTFWDFVSLMPESAHMVMWAMSDRAIPRSFRMMEGFGVHTYRFVSETGKSTFVKFHWRPKLGMQSVVWDEALKISGADPDFHRRDLWNAINEGQFPEWELGLQLFDQRFAEDFDFDVLDATKLIPEEILPLRVVGRLVLDRNVSNFFAETEQVAFCVRWRRTRRARIRIAACPALRNRWKATNSVFDPSPSQITFPRHASFSTHRPSPNKITLSQHLYLS
jgi:catalase